MKTHYRATFAGLTIDRKSSREYTHAWRIRGVSKHDKPGEERTRDITGFAKSAVHARNAAIRESSWMVDPVVEVVAVILVPAKMRGTVVTIAHREETLPQGWTLVAHSDQVGGAAPARWHTWTHPAGEINVSGDPDAAGRTWHAWRVKGASTEQLKGEPSHRRPNGNTLKFATASAAATAALAAWDNEHGTPHNG